MLLKRLIMEVGNVKIAIRLLEKCHFSMGFWSLVGNQKCGKSNLN